MTLLEKYTRLGTISKGAGALGLVFASAAVLTFVNDKSEIAAVFGLVSVVAGGTSNLFARKRNEAAMAYVTSNESPQGYTGVY